MQDVASPLCGDKRMVRRCMKSKETPNNTISPHYFLHNESGSAAIAASVDFLIGKGECNITL
jgi:hypothetical protein